MVSYLSAILRYVAN